jgi:hypothetical protein
MRACVVAVLLAQVPVHSFIDAPAHPAIARAGRAHSSNARAACLPALPTTALRATGDDQASSKKAATTHCTTNITATAHSTASITAAAGAAGAFFGYAALAALDLELELYGAAAGGVLALYMTAQNGPVGEASRAVGLVTLGAAQVLKNLVADSKVTDKAIGVISTEILEVVELTSAAVSKGVQSSKPLPQSEAEAQVICHAQCMHDTLCCCLH